MCVCACQMLAVLVNHLETAHRGPLSEQNGLLIAEPSLQPQKLFCLSSFQFLLRQSLVIGLHLLRADDSAASGPSAEVSKHLS